ncbi:MAG: rRNA maturation RNase YbeY [Kiritimatiellaeota bacterium]|nr:rRNA maturation RNase YbeY [Kiritimatiellota bacterium]
MLLTITNRRRNPRIDLPALRRLCVCLYALCSGVAVRRRRAKHQQTDIKSLESVELILCGDAEITCVHAAVFNDPTTTDVITIPYAATPVSGATAEIFVNTRLACDSAPEHETTPARELALYIAHGFDHLAGYSDLTPRGRDTMRKRELSWLNICEKQGLLDIIR